MKNIILITVSIVFFSLYSQAQNRMDSMTFYKDYFPGTNDINGKYLGSTETMVITQHKGKLFAGMSNWMDYPITPQHEGTQILRKDAYNAPWVVDTSVGFTSLRSNAMVSVFFSKDFNGQQLNPKVNILVGGFSDIINPRIAGIWVRNDITNQWYKNNVVQLQSEAGIRSFEIHTDKITNKQYLFAGLTAGSIVKAQYDGSSPGHLIVDTAKELSGLGRVMAMCVCNGDLYAAAGVDLNGTHIVGGLYRRIDGITPTWQLVYRWTYTPGTPGDERNIMRGITCIPDPLGSNNEVIIGTRSKGALVEAIEPFNNHNVRIELHITDYFGNALFGGTWPYNNYATSAFNNFTPDTINGQQVWWLGVGIINERYTNLSDNGSFFLLRFKNGTYKWGYINDVNYPIPLGKSLRATRTICKSPFPEDSLNVYYFGGYICSSDISNNTSWIYKGVKNKNTTAIVDSIDSHNFVIFPNPSNTEINIALPSTEQFQIEIVNSLGQSIFIDQNKNKIDISKFPKGIYYFSVKQGKKNYLQKLIKQ